MSTNERPGLAMNEELVEHHVRETREQAQRARYPERPTPLHAKMTPAEPLSDALDWPEPARKAERVTRTKP